MLNRIKLDLDQTLSLDHSHFNIIMIH